MDRRAFISGITGGLLAAPLAVGAQPAGKVHRVGFIGNSTAVLESNLVEPWREGFRELGYVEGRDLIIEYRWADGDYGRLPALVAELIALKVDVLVTAGTPAALAVKRATKTIPLVMVAVGDPASRHDRHDPDLLPVLARDRRAPLAPEPTGRGPAPRQGEVPPRAAGPDRSPHRPPGSALALRSDARAPRSI